MIVAGGVYDEISVMPRRRCIFGSGGRAAVFLASAGAPVELHTFCPTHLQKQVDATLGGAGVDICFHHSPAQPSFRYLHPLAKPVVTPWPVTRVTDFNVGGEIVLRFGMMEGEAIVSAKRAVYDPQSPLPASFRDNGSHADELAIVSNHHELRSSFPGLSEAESVAALASRERAAVVIVKAGAIGAQVYVDGQFVGTAPPYKSERIFKIGSGDVFSAAFTHAWAREARSPLDAADFASRAVAHYCETLDLTVRAVGAIREPIAFRPGGLVYLAAPFFCLADLWLVEEAARCLVDVGATVFSPYHEVGHGAPDQVVKADLDALDASTAVLAVMSGNDPGTIFEVGYAVARHKPVIILAEANRESDETMMTGTGCEIVRDFATAVYRAAWASWQ